MTLIFGFSLKPYRLTGAGRYTKPAAYTSITIDNCNAVFHRNCIHLAPIQADFTADALFMVQYGVIA
jgi:hypothetical protein